MRLLIGSVCLPLAGERTGAAAPPSIVVRLDPSLAGPAVSGRLYVFLSTRPQGEPIRGPNWFRPEPFFAIDVQEFAPGQSRTLDDSADSFPKPLTQLGPGQYRVQAVLDLKLESPHPSRGTGNLVSEVVSWSLEALESRPVGPVEPVELTLVRRIEPPAFPNRNNVREMVLRSPRLSAFHGRDVFFRAAVVLPEGFDSSSDRRYPVLYYVPGFGGTHRDYAQHGLVVGPQQEDEEPMLRVLVSGDCPWGHHVLADSATNGPRGTAFIEEFLPFVEQSLPARADAGSRFLAGHSSGGWAALWVLVHWPGHFAGAWSLAPDPVDFRDYQQVNLYADPPENMYRDGAGDRRPLARSSGKPLLWYDDFTRMDDVLSPGGQLRSFEAAFSPLDAAGRPRRMYDRVTGQVDRQVALAWQAYDISQILERDWHTLGGRLAGKLHVVAGGADTFYLDGAVRRLAERLAALGSDARIEILEGESHSSFLNQDFESRIRREMSERFRQALGEAAGVGAPAATTVEPPPDAAGPATESGP